MEFLIGPLACEELREQCERAEVVARCSCGCPSVGLRSDAPALTPAVMRRLSHAGRDDVLSVTAWGMNHDEREVEVTLHVVLGVVEELEVWAGGDGGEVVTEVPVVETMRRE